MAIPSFVLDLRAAVGHRPALAVRRDRGRAARATDAEVLLVRRADTGAWTPVTGIIDPGEQPAVAAAREVLEEASVVAVPERLAWVNTLAPMRYENGDQAQYLDHTFRFRWVSGEPTPGDEENTEAAFFPLDALPPMSSEMRARIERALRPDGPADFGF